MDKKLLDEIIEKHRVWLEYGGKKGERAKLQGVDLRAANLQKINLREADLHEANLQEANLQEADLRGADLRWTDMRIAYLRVADLRGADLSGANLRGADLWVADLRGAKLKKAILREANLQETDLRDAQLDEANLKYIKITKSTLDFIPDDIQEQYKEDWYIIGIDDEPPHRFIEFPKGYYKGIADILIHFGTLLQKRPTDPSAEIRISQNGLKLTLSISSENGSVERIEQFLKKDNIGSNLDVNIAGGSNGQVCNKLDFIDDPENDN